jgi:hypothetical protein
MPYFKLLDTNILFIHIPKTGGSSLEKYFSIKYNIPHNEISLLSSFSPIYNYLRVSLQHMTLQTLISNKELFGIDLNSLKIITIVRNPYNRLVSELFYLSNYSQCVSVDDLKTPESINKLIINIFSKYVNDNCIYDNHIRPQYEFLTINNDERLYDNLIILKTEELDADMHEHGYIDFNLKENCNNASVDYMSLLNNESINLINNFYREDFEYFGYEMKIIDDSSKDETPK